MQITMTAPGLDKQTRAVLALLHSRDSFIKLWAMSAANEARATARRKPGRRWWRDLARSVQVRQVSVQTAEVSSAQRGANLKQYGGTIRPVRKKCLTIPIAPEAKGKSAYEMQRPSRPLFRLPGTRLLGYSAKGQFRPLFALVKSATQAPDPWFPANARLRALAAQEAKMLFDKEQRLWISPR